MKLSAIFNGYPEVLQSGVEARVAQSTNYLVNYGRHAWSERRKTWPTCASEARALAPDGTQVRDSSVTEAFEASGLPAEAELRRQITEVAEHVTALAKAPAGEAYDGPMLFEAGAAAQLFGQVLGDNLKVTRKPITDPGRNAPYAPSELENRLGARVLPEWMDVVDDPSQTELRGQPLLGHYLYDIEGVAAQPLTLVEKGLLKSFLTDANAGAQGLSPAPMGARA